MFFFGCIHMVNLLASDPEERHSLPGGYIRWENDAPCVQCAMLRCILLLCDLKTLNPKFLMQGFHEGEGL